MSTEIAPIRPIEEASRQRIVAGQAVFDLTSAVKELIDNAIDAGAKTITIRLSNQGIDMIEVTDDGMGVPKDSRPFLATAHATSKISSFDDIYNPSNQQSLGFRGEALFCLANLSTNLIIASRTAEETVAEKMEFQRDGSLRPGSLTKLPKKVGTTVSVEGLLEAVPVRRADMIRRIKDQRRKLIKLVSGYGVFSPGVKIQLLEVSGKSKDKILLATPSNSKSTGEVIGVLFGTKYLATLTDFYVDISHALCIEEESYVDNQETLQSTSRHECLTSTSSAPKGKVVGFLSKIASGPGTERVSEHQIFSINKRPVDLPKFSRMLNDVWRTLTGHTGRSNPSCILEFQLPHNFYDINVAPDKREVILQNESEILDCLQRFATEFWSCQKDGQFDIASDIEASPAGGKQPQYAVKSFANKGSDQSSHPKRKLNEIEVTDISAWDAKVENEESVQDYAGLVSTQPSDVVESDSKKGHEDTMDGAQESLVASPTQEVNDTPANTFPSINTAAAKGHSLADRTSAEDRLWRAAKRRLNETSRSESRLAENNAFAQFRTSSATRSAPLRTIHNGKKSTIPSYNLERFGFQSTTDRSSTEQEPHSRKSTTTSVAKKTKSSKVRSFEIMLESTSDRESKDSTSSDDDSESDEESSSPVIEEGANVDDAIASSVSDEDETEALSQSKDEDSNVRPSSSQESPHSPASISKVGVIWNSFDGTDSVISASRRERLAMMQRKKTPHAVKAPEIDINEEENSDANTKGGNKISLQKSDFENMKVIGQFNMGFILAKSPNNHIWILDQHACDEKANFEKLVRETVIHEQPLIAPMPLELSHSEESCVVDNMDIFEKNGFRFRYDQDKSPRHRLSLTAIPHSGAQDGRKAVQFGKEDVSVLCNILGADDTGTSYDSAAGSGTGADGSGIYGNNAVRRYVSRADNSDRVLARLPKAIAMFASRACRGSIMIGKALSNKEMDSIVKKLSAIDHPWNCPHGRPTLRHAANLNKLIEKDILRDETRLAGPTVNILTQDA